MANLTRSSRELTDKLIDFYNSADCNILDKNIINISKIRPFLNFLYSIYCNQDKNTNINDVSFEYLNNNERVQLYKLNRTNYFLNNRYIPIEIIEYIDTNINNFEIIKYTFVNRCLHLYKINIYFIKFKDSNITKKEINESVQNIILIFNLLIHLSGNNELKCSHDNINIYIYLTPLKRTINNAFNKTDNDTSILGETQANGGFCYGCVSKQNIVIYRREDYFKTLIHELVHNFGIDQSLFISGLKSQQIIKSIFNIDIYTKDNNFNYGINESYTEFWACILNISLFSYKNTRTNKQFIELFGSFMNIEIVHSLVQIVKILHQNNLKYNDIISNDKINYYRETTHIMSYYILKTILLYNYIELIERGTIFKKILHVKSNTINISFDIKKLIEFQNFIGIICRKTEFIELINKFTKLYTNKYIDQFTNFYFNKLGSILISNMRMVTIEYI
jgi:hypothetical protein